MARPASASNRLPAANERGYELAIVTDAVTDPDEGAHLNSLRAIFPRIAELATTEEVLTALARTG
jgi:isochorismate hydrolase